MRVLYVEDSPRLLRSVAAALERTGYAVDTASDGEEGLWMAGCAAYDAVILDIMLPGRDGLSILRGLRERRMSVPVLLLTARGELNERLEGLNLGADDYLAKPFYLEELIARLQAVTRRASGNARSLLAVEDLTIDLLAHAVTRGGEPIELTAREFGLLERLARAPGRVFTRAQLLEQVWNSNFDPGTNLVDVYVQRLRRKVDGDRPQKLIETVRGVGYRIRGRG